MIFGLLPPRRGLSYGLNVALIACAIAGRPGTARAQWEQFVTYHGPRVGSSTTAIEAAMNVNFEDARTHSAAAPTTRLTDAPKDSMFAVAAKRAQEWLTSLQRSGVRGLQVDPYGVLAVLAGDESVAQQQIAARLATPGLSLVDRGFTLRMAVNGFADPRFPVRLPIAERYLAQIDALGENATYWQLYAREPLLFAYYRLGRTPDVIRVGTQLLEHLTDLPFEFRAEVVNKIEFNYGMVIDALSGQPNGRVMIRALNKKLLAATDAPPALVALDSAFWWGGETMREKLQGLADMSERVGRQGTPLVSNYWVNRGATRDSQTVAVNDGKIRIIEIGHFGCAPCVGAIPVLERLRRKYPDVEYNFLTWTDGTWGNRIVEPQVEADRLSEHFLTNLHATFPIGIWKSRRVPTEDGGSVAQMESPMWNVDQYPQVSKPTFYILDGKGMIRSVRLGHGRDLEESLMSVIEYLQHDSGKGA